MKIERRRDKDRQEQWWSEQGQNCGDTFKGRIKPFVLPFGDLRSLRRPSQLFLSYPFKSSTVHVT